MVESKGVLMDLAKKMFDPVKKNPYYLGERAIRNLRELRQNLDLFTEKEAIWVADWLEYLGDPKTAQKIREKRGDFKAIVINRYAELWHYR
ncbi:MAG: hypothetical protein HY555_01745 [Euryarchaeota archaeon]|nr:hypothetical protein [Euryarchaeota archaeon]